LNKKYLVNFHPVTTLLCLLISTTQHWQCACFRTTFNFDCKYLWNKWRYRQAVNNVFSCDLFQVIRKKLVDLDSLTTKLCLLISTYPTLTVCALTDNFGFWSRISW